ncbi:uncharacterized protein LOC114291784 [Camellia sinensis]|uniref:uncharacterized protein LOC114291784 n=1 Tax=Camellia sinensis TaxID=4442 RepID=UPI0010365C8D|nr:uncharacterized protein LOC114291784 [Camellia sinensis]
METINKCVKLINKGSVSKIRVCEELCLCQEQQREENSSNFQLSEAPGAKMEDGHEEDHDDMSELEDEVNGNDDVSQDHKEGAGRTKDGNGSSSLVVSVVNETCYEVGDPRVTGTGKMHQVIECVVVNVYAPNDRSMRRILWKILGNLKPKFSKPWCIGGDFNEVEIVVERKGCIRRDGGMNEFNDFVNTLELVDVPMIGRKYKWCNSQEREKWSRLDRFLVSPEWLEWFSFKLWGLSRSLYNHCPILLMEDERDWSPKPFRFLNAWVLHPTFMNKVKLVWDSTQVDGWAGFRLKVKLKSLKETLKVWNNEVFGNAEYKLKEAEHAIHALDLVAEVRPLNDVELSRRREVKWKIRKLRKMKEWSIEPYQAELMVKEFSGSEIRAAIKECDGNNAPRPNGFNLICIQKGWRIMKDDILKFMAEFHVNGRLVKGLSVSFISLISKKENPTTYDTVNWSFLFDMLGKFGFETKWVEWMKTCLGSARVSFLVNGSSSEEVCPQKGLRQGDPISPFLFITIAEGLNILLSRDRELGLIKGVIIGNEGLKLFHLQFANDTINYHKSAISGVRIDEVTVANFASRLNCMSQQLPFKYLGMPLGANPRRKQIWKPVVDKFKAKLAGWTRRVLSFASRVTLSNSVLSNLPVYYMALFKMPQGIAKEIDKMLLAFLWGDIDLKRKLHLVKWKEVTVS